MAVQEQHKIVGKFFIAIRVNGQEIPSTPELCLNLNIIESIDQIGMTAILDYKDIGSLLINFIPVMGNELFEIDLGHDETSIKTYKFRLMKVETLQTFQQTLVGIYRFTLLDDIAFEMGLKTRIRSWKNTKISSMVKDIANDYNFDRIIIEETSKPFTMVQPNVTDSYFIARYLPRYAKSMNYNVGGYLTFINSNREFNFVSYEHIKSRKRSNVKKATFLRGTEEARGDKVFDVRVGNNIQDVYNSGYGFNSLYFDTLKGKMVSTERSLNDTKIRSLTDHIMIDKNILNSAVPNRTHYTGRMSKEFNENIHETIGDFSISNKVNNLINQEIVILGDNDLTVGDIINVDMPKSNEEDFSSPYSGYWMIKSIIRNVRERGNYVMKLKLIRTGLSLDQSSSQMRPISPPGGKA